MVGRVLHLSDTHLQAPGALHQGVVDTTARLRHVLDHLASLGDLAAVVVSGDVSDDGSAASYATARDLVGAFADARGAAVVWAAGNHDVRGPFTDVLGPARAVHDLDGLRVVVLDSSVPGKGYGLLGAEQLDALRSTLARPAPRGTLVVVHHGPVPAPTVLHRGLQLQDGDDLLAALAGTDVRAVLCGHYHHGFVRVVDGLPVVVAPGVANRTDLLAPHGVERAVQGAGAVLLDVPADPADGVLATVLDVPVPGAGEQVLLLDEAQVAQVLAAAGPPAP